jgi:hypothetical protein
MHAAAYRWIEGSLARIPKPASVIEFGAISTAPRARSSRSALRMSAWTGVRATGWTSYATA